MDQEAVAGRTARGPAGSDPADGERAGSGGPGRTLAVPAGAVLLAGLIIGVLGDALLRAPGDPGLSMFVCVASVAVAALVLHRRAGVALDRGRVVWLGLGVLLMAGWVWRDSPPLKLLALGCATLMFALAAYRPAAAWVRRAGVFRYVRAWATGALHAWTAAAPVLLEAGRSTGTDEGRSTALRRSAGVVRGLLIAAPFVVVFGALFMSADAVFAQLVRDFVQIDFQRIVGHVVLFGICAWLATGYLRGFLTGTELPPLRQLLGELPRRPALGVTEVATVLAVLDLLFLLFVSVQFRYLFGGDVLVQVTPDLTYAEYARRGFFELVFAVFLVAPVLLAADWLLERRTPRDEVVFRALAGLQIALVMAITASAFQRLRLYYSSYGLTDSRLYAMVLLGWIGLMLLWFAATVLRGRRDAFAFGALVSGLATVALLFSVNPDATIARTNVARALSPDAPAAFDVAYARSLSADAVPVLLDALPALPRDVRCPLARHLLRRFTPDRETSVRNWNWSASRARAAMREHESTLTAAAEFGAECGTSGSG